MDEELEGINMKYMRQFVKFVKHKIKQEAKNGTKKENKTNLETHKRIRQK